MKMTQEEIIQAVKDKKSLRGANLRGADLLCVNLHCADLSYADLHCANLQGANLHCANLQGANLYCADLSDANLSGANLRDADLHCANLYGADLYGADLYGADLRDAIGLLSIIPEEGSFVAFKKLSNGTIAKLLIPEDAERVGSFTGRKCRASKAIVLEGEGNSSHDQVFFYAKGETVIPDSFDPDPRVECSHGIHFFLTRKEAEKY